MPIKLKIDVGADVKTLQASYPRLKNIETQLKRAGRPLSDQDSHRDG